MKVASKYTDDATIANRYLADQLDDAEREAFEAALVQDPEIVKELEATARLKVGLEKLRETGELESLAGRARVFSQPVWLAAAASVAVVAVGLVMVRWVSAPAPSLLAASVAAFVDESGQPPGRGPTHTMLRMRSVNYDATIELPAARQALELRVLPSVPDQASRYRGSLLRMRDDGTTEVVATVRGLSPGENGFISIFADSALLEPGRYQLTLTGEEMRDPTASADVFDTFMIRILPAPQP